MSPMETQEIQDRVRGMSEDQMRAALTMIPYGLLYQELVFRYESLLKRYTDDLNRVSGTAISIDTLPHS